MRTGNPAWQKGTSGNPGGRKPIPPEVREMARAASPAALNALTDIVGDKDQPAGARVSAATVILDRAWGKAEQTINANITRVVHDVSDDELLAIATGRSRSLVESEDGPRPSDPVH